MTPERWRQVRNLFDAVLERRADERQAFLEDACAGDPQLRGEVGSLLRAHRRPATLLARPTAPGSPWIGDGDGDGDPVGAEVGAYRIQCLLGRGGMGAVYLAARADGAYRQEVAVKLLKRGLDTDELVRRFRLERQILAQLDHPNITKLLDGGSTADGRPYLVMEHVRGIRIDRWCDRRRSTVAARLRLFAKVCAAVQVAHQHLIVHRDLKPGNVLITEAGEPKLLDFGIAKLLGPAAEPGADAATLPGVSPMTPAYASPEQVRGAGVTTASDVYALGVMLYELLTGRRPYRLDGPRPEQVLAALGSRPPPPMSVALGRPAQGGERPLEQLAADRGSDPRRLRRRLRGDLDTIVATAMHHDPRRRYPSVAQLAQDLANHLAERPVSARRDTWSYRTGRFLRRHRLAAAVVAAALVALAVLGGQRRQIADQRGRAAVLADTLGALFQAPDPARSGGQVITAQDLLGRGALLVEDRLAAQPVTGADLLAIIGRSVRSLGRYGQAEALFARAVALRRGHLGDHHPAVAAGEQELGTTLLLAGRYDQSERHLRRALAARQRLLGPEHPAIVESLGELARLLERRGDYRASEARFAQALAMARRLGSDAALGDVLNRFAILRSRQGRFAEAETLLREALAVRRQALGGRHPEVAETLNNLALSLHERGASAAAEARYGEAIAIQETLYGGSHPQLATTLTNLARLRNEAGRLASAEALFERALAMLEAGDGPEHPNTAGTLTYMADLRFDQGRDQEAETLHRRALAMRRRLLDAGHPDIAFSLANLARVVRRRGAAEEARALLEEALLIGAERLGDRHPEIAAMLANRGQLALAEGDRPAAEAAFRRALAINRAVYGGDHPEVAKSLVNLADVEQAAGDLEAAAAGYQQAVAAFTAHHGADHADTVGAGLKLAQLELARGRPAAAEPLARAALAHFEAHLGADHVWVAAARYLLGRSLFDLGRMDAALPFVDDTFRRLRAERGLSSPATRDALERLIAVHQALGRRDEAARLGRLRAAGG